MREFLAIISLFVTVPFIWWSWTTDLGTSEPEITDPTAGARYACSRFIENFLNDPDSVEWVDRLHWQTGIGEDGTITVRAEYRARNAMGGMVREVTFCDIIREDGQLRLTDIRQ